jgi:hypothetical protein
VPGTDRLGVPQKGKSPRGLVPRAVSTERIMIMGVHEAIALTQGVSLAKTDDAPVMVAPVLVLDCGRAGVAVFKVNLVKSRGGCDWCAQEGVRALYVADAGDGWVDRMCRHHALRWGRFVG